VPRLSGQLALAVALTGTLATAAAAQAGSPTREAGAQYTAPGGSQHGATVNVGGQGGALGSARLPTRPDERVVTLQVSDDSGRPVAAEVVQVLDEQTGAFVMLGEVCGQEPQTFRLQRAGAPVVVRPLVGVCEAGPSAPTSGAVSAVFRTR
jgi:hypothetical protein